METIVFLGLAAGPLLTIAALLLLLDFFLLFNTRPADEKRYALTFIGSLAACMFVIASYLILTAAFLTDSFSFREVYAYSSTGLSVLYKLGGPWIGSSGSLLFIAALLALGYAIYRVRSFEHGGEVRIAACQLLDLFLAFFILVTLPFTLAFVAALIGCYATLTRKNYAVLIAAVAAAGIGLAVAGIPTPYALANLGLPLLITATGVVGYRWLQTIRERKSLRVRGRTLLHLAIVLTLVGVFISSAAQSESDLIPVSQGSGIPAPGSVISIKNFTVFPGTGSVYYPPHAAVAPEYAGLETGVEIAEGGGVQAGSLRMYDYLNYGIISEPLIVSSPARDLYISMHQTNSSYTSLLNALAGEVTVPADVTIVVKSVPLIWLVWIGIVLMGIGMAAVCLDELFRQKKRRRSP